MFLIKWKILDRVTGEVTIVYQKAIKIDEENMLGMNENGNVGPLVQLNLVPYDWEAA